MAVLTMANRRFIRVLAVATAAVWLSACAIQVPRRPTGVEQAILAQARGANLTAGVLLRGISADLHRKYGYAYADPARLEAARKSAERHGTAQERQEINTVAREIVYGNRLIDALRRSGLFREVHYAHAFEEKPDILIEDIGPRQEVKAELSPWTLATVLTLGIVPSGTSRLRQYSFTLREADAASAIEIHYRFKELLWFGWGPALLTLHPDWSWNASDARERDDFALRILASPGALKTLLVADRRRELYGNASVTRESVEILPPVRLPEEN